MPIDLGLARVARLLAHLNSPTKAFKAIHVAGTNGKGSTVAYLSSVLTAARVRNGRFVSPHMLYYNDCIAINNEVYPVHKFQRVSQLVLDKNTLHDVGCTEFELLTVTAFKIFAEEKVDIAIIEVGLGGRLDATNVLEPHVAGCGSGGVIATGITKIGMDHEGFLGDTLAKIAFEKAGIIKNNVPNVVDGTNDKEVVEVIRNRADEQTAPLFVVDGNGAGSHGLQTLTSDQFEALAALTPLQGEYQRQNLCVALKLVEIVQQKHLPTPIDYNTLQQGVAATTWQGRLQTVQIPGTDRAIVIDGAHNESAAIELGKYLERFRTNDGGIVFVVALTLGKSADNLLKHITRPNDKVIVTTFTAPDQMPWVSSYSTDHLHDAAKQYVDDVVVADNGIEQVLQYAAEDPRPLVACGSLYLCGDILRSTSGDPPSN